MCNELLSLIAYVAAIALQVAGALMLIIFAISTKRKAIIRSFAKSQVIARDGDTKELSYNHEAFIDMYRTAYYSKISVCFIATGYLLGIFGNIRDPSRVIVAVFVVVVTAVLIIATKGYVQGEVKKDKVQKRITDEELKAAGVDADIESISSSEIKKLFADEVYHKEKGN